MRSPILFAFVLSLALPCSAQDSVTSQPALVVLEWSLEDVMELAVSNNIGLELQKIDTEIARYDFLGSWGAFDAMFDASLAHNDRQFEGSSFLSGGSLLKTKTTSLNLDFAQPMTTGGSFAAHFDTTFEDTNSMFSNFPESYSDNVSVSFTQPLRRGAWREYATSNQRESEIAFQKQMEAQRGARQQLFFDVQNTYWDLVAAMEQREVGVGALGLALEQHQRNIDRLEAGVGTEVEVLQAETDVAQRREALLALEAEVLRAMDNLKVFLFSGQEEELWDHEIRPTTPLPETISNERSAYPDWMNVLLVSLERRSDLRQLRLDVDSARVRHKRSVSDRLSGVDLALTASSSGFDRGSPDAFRDASSFEFPSLSATLTYNMPIGNRSASYAEQAARSRVRSALLVYDQTENTVVSEVRDAVRQVRYQAAAVSASTATLGLAQRQLKAEQDRYEVDLSTNYQVIEFQQALVEAESNERQARVNFVKALVALQNVQGTLGEEDTSE
jgi:outer membrane protein TolC